ncbi:MAG: metal-sensitive transcriptional regulator [Actinomycetes bacterium]|nr:metal-sensitive transcriptional regulator [Actinomycetes bacterium]MDX5381272.1 metal-sensitive transcriptional regulator [Actinomycetes bacterium]MDX5400619.1 metal-sensitive transcriptional regulator [Actinomycetes bacterium]MDX5451047.1 metal-sensitive transcriptional regulator [Actinomycetes bacterium]NCD19054.1 metal-sensitive transcriptional regulator [Actinomycetota bacterium]
MQLTGQDLVSVRNRLSRANGQLAAVIRLLDEGGDCEVIVTQLAACSKALDKAGFQIIAASLRQCIEDPDATMDQKKLEKLFLTLS